MLVGAEEGLQETRAGTAEGHDQRRTVPPVAAGMSKCSRAESAIACRTIQQPRLHALGHQ